MQLLHGFQHVMLEALVYDTKKVNFASCGMTLPVLSQLFLLVIGQLYKLSNDIGLNANIELVHLNNIQKLLGWLVIRPLHIIGYPDLC